MNKKASLILLLPMLCSCHGGNASTQTVLQNVLNIRGKYNYSMPSYQRFTLKKERNLSEYKEYTFEAFDREKKFYHCYKIENQKFVYEKWRYVQTNSDGDTNIYDVQTLAKEVGQSPVPTLVGKITYSDEEWNKLDSPSSLRENIENYHSKYLNESESIIKSYETKPQNKNLSLGSFNETSYYLEYVEKDDQESIVVEKKTEFKDTLFLLFTCKESQDVQTTINCSYESFDILYPKL